MGKAVAPPTGYDQTTGQAIYDPDAAPVAAADYIASLGFQPATVQVNTKTASFDFTDFGV